MKKRYREVIKSIALVCACLWLGNLLIDTSLHLQGIRFFAGAAGMGLLGTFILACVNVALDYLKAGKPIDLRYMVDDGYVVRIQSVGPIERDRSGKDIVPLLVELKPGVTIYCRVTYTQDVKYKSGYYYRHFSKGVWKDTLVPIEMSRN